MVNRTVRAFSLILPGLACATLTFASPASADVPGLAPFVGSWHAHAERLVIQPDGHGHETYADMSACPSCSFASAPQGFVDFALMSVSSDTASGTVTAASDPNKPVGSPVSVTLVGGGQGLQLTVQGGDQGFPFCNDSDNPAALQYYCGA